MGVGRGVAGRGVMVLAVLGPALLALGVAPGPPLRGLDAPPPAGRGGQRCLADFASGSGTLVQLLR